jgi:hypothetical protein
MKNSRTGPPPSGGMAAKALDMEVSEATAIVPPTEQVLTVVMEVTITLPLPTIPVEF